MTYATYISSLRAMTGDNKVRQHIDWTGDGATTVFQIPTGCFPVYDSGATRTVKVAGLAQTEGVDVTIDERAGFITFLNAPALNAAITMDHLSVHLRDADWVDTINKTILSLGDDFFTEFTDDTLTTTAGMTSISLAADLPECFDVRGLWYRNTSSDEWVPMSNIANWRYSREDNTIYFGTGLAFTTAGQLKVRGLNSYTISTTLSDSIPVQDRFMTILDYGVQQRYWQFRYQDVVELVSKFTQENSRTQLQELMMLADRFMRQYEQEKARLKPSKPPYTIPNFLNGKGHA